MSIASIAANLGLSAANALKAQTGNAPNAGSFPPAAGTANASNSNAGNVTTGSSNPFSQLSSDLQAWLTQLQAGGNAGQSPAASGGTAANPDTATAGTQATTPKHYHHRHAESGAGATSATPSAITGTTTEAGNASDSIIGQLTKDLSQAFKSYAATANASAASITI